MRARTGATTRGTHDGVDEPNGLFSTELAVSDDRLLEAELLCDSREELEPP